MLATLGYGGVTSRFEPHDMDTLSYLFQAKLLAQGRIAAEKPASLGFSPSTHINVADGLWYSKYPPGQALALALGVKAGAVWIVPVGATGAAIVLLYLLVLNTFGVGTAKVAVLLGVLSPPTYVMGSLLFSEAVDRVLIGGFLLTGVLAFKTGRSAWAAASGLLLGLAFDTRPLAAIAVGVAGVSVLALIQVTAMGAATTIRTLCVFAVSGACAAGVTFGWNYHLTGDPLTPTFTVVQPFDRLGFGLRATGHRPSFLQRHTPIVAVRRLASRTIPAVLQNSLGLGFYDHRMYDWLARGTLRQRAVMAVASLGFIVPVALLAAGLRRRAARWATALFASIVVANVAAYALYWFDGVSFGHTAANTRYHTEATMFGLLPLLASGLTEMWSRYRLRIRSLSTAAGLGVLILLAANYGYNAYRAFSPTEARGRVLRAQARALETLPDQSVVFFKGAQFIPLGDYPFTSLAAARVVTFRLTCSAEWGLAEDSASKVYAQYFTGRTAFQWEGGQLQHLDMNNVPPDPSHCVPDR